MFKFFKEKLKGAIAKFSKKAEEAGAEAPVKEKEEKAVKAEKREKKEKPKVKKAAKKPAATPTVEAASGAEKEAEEEIPQEPKKVSFFQKLREVVTTKALSKEQFEELFSELEIALLENNVAYEVVEKIKQDLKSKLVEQKVLRGKISSIVGESLRHSIQELFAEESLDLFAKIKEKKEKPFVIVFFGVNGSGKTTTIAKLAYALQKNKLNCVIAAGDTFRAAAIQQLEEHANKLGIKLIKHDYGADPAAVGFDAIKYAKAKSVDVVLMDTAGRQHSNVNLMDEMKKIVRVCKPDLKIFVGEAITGNDCVEQAKTFHDAIGFDAIILTKLDVDEKGGAFVSVSHVTGKPILYVGMGQKYEDLKPFEKETVMRNLGL